MAKPVVISFAGSSASFQHSKVDRAKLYGAKRRIAVDPQGSTCTRSSMTADGRFILMSGMTAQGYFDDQGVTVQRSELVTLTDTGEVLPVLPSTLGTSQEAVEITATEVLDYVMESHYVLTPESVDEPIANALAQGRILRFPFNATAGVNCETGFLLQTGGQIFCLVGNPATFQWSEPAVVTAIDPQEEESTDDLDFDMF